MGVLFGESPFIKVKCTDIFLTCRHNLLSIKSARMLPEASQCLERITRSLWVAIIVISNTGIDAAEVITVATAENVLSKQQNKLGASSFPCKGLFGF